MLAAPFGLIIGSFLNVVAYRLPLKKSIAFQPSHCPSCEAAVKPYDNLPVISWWWAAMVFRSRRSVSLEPRPE